MDSGELIQFLEIYLRYWIRQKLEIIDFQKPEIISINNKELRIVDEPDQPR